MLVLANNTQQKTNQIHVNLYSLDMPLGIGHVWAMTSLLSRSYIMNTPLGIGHVGADYKRGDS